MRLAKDILAHSILPHKELIYWGGNINFDIKLSRINKEEITMSEKKKWISKALPPSSKGKLREKLDVKGGETISAKKLDKALHSKNSTTRKEAQLAKTLKGFKK